MFDGDKGAIFALGLVVGIALAFAISFWSFPWFAYPSYEAVEGVSRHGKAPQNGKELLESYLPTFVTATDTLAQWFMMFFALAATIISIWAIKLVRATLIETKKTAISGAAAANSARDANRIAYEQFQLANKPWLKIEISGPYIEVGEMSANDMSSISEGDTVTRPIEIKALVSITNTSENIAIVVEGHVKADVEIVVNRASKYFEVLHKGETIFMDWAMASRRGALRRLAEVTTPDRRHLASMGIVEMGFADRERLMTNPPPIIGYVKYLDGMNNKYQAGFAFAPNGTINANSWHRWGGERWNYDRKIENEGG